MFSLLCVFSLFCLTGCNGGKKQQEQQAASADASAREILERKRLCSDNFSKIYLVLRPEPENVDTELQSALDILNQWYSSCAEWSGTQLADVGELFAAITGNAAELTAELNRQTGSQHDILYLRDQLLMRSMLEDIVRDIPTDAEKVRRLFEYVCRNVAYDEKLIHPSLPLNPAIVESLKPRTIPRTLQDICLAGRGSAEDRAWVLAGLLQQSGLQALLVNAPESAEVAGLRYQQLLLVALDEGILVFSPGLGIEFRQPEKLWTAADFQDNWKNIFTGLAIESPGFADAIKPLTALEWSKAKLFMPYSPLLVSPRMEVLQLEFVGDYVCEVYHPLKSTEMETGLVDQFTKSLGIVFTDFQPVFWDYPQLMYQRFVDSTELEEQLRSLSLATLMKEVQSLRSSEDQNEQKVFKASLEKRMLMARIDQLIGDHSDAIATYIKLRLQQGVAGAGDAVAIENLMRILQAEDSHYWSALAQFENDDFRAAADTLKNYLNRYQPGRWSLPAQELLIRTLIAQGDKAQAEQLLKDSQWPAEDELRKQILLQAP